MRSCYCSEQKIFTRPDDCASLESFFVMCIIILFTMKIEKFQLRGNNSVCAGAFQLLGGCAPVQLRGNITSVQGSSHVLQVFTPYHCSSSPRLLLFLITACFVAFINSRQNLVPVRTCPLPRFPSPPKKHAAYPLHNWFLQSNQQRKHVT
jgi:hypothetical protein